MSLLGRLFKVVYFSHCSILIDKNDIIRVMRGLTSFARSGIFRRVAYGMLAMGNPLSV